MATLYKHGEIGQIERLTFKVAYCADGNILRNDGYGWKIWRKIKEGIDPVELFHKKQKEYQEKLISLPCFAAWRKAIHAFPLKHRAIIVEGVRMLGNDLDGLTSELQDYGIQIDYDETKELNDAYEAALEEQKLNSNVQKQS